eukprot:3042032-Pyramimonas_sp.AAC.1
MRVGDWGDAFAVRANQRAAEGVRGAAGGAGGDATPGKPLTSTPRPLKFTPRPSDHLVTEAEREVRRPGL